MIKKIYRFLLLSPEEIGLDNYLVILISLLASIAGFLGTLVNIYLRLGPTLILSTFFSFLFFLFAYYLGRVKRKHFFSKYITIILLLFTINMQWFLNYGSYGPILYLFVVIQSYIIFLFDKIPRKIFSVAIFINITLLFYLEYQYPDLFQTYPDRLTRLFDLYSSAIVYLFLSITLIFVALDFHIRQTEKAQKADYLKTAFLTNITHEIRTPMNAILGFSQLLEKVEKEEKRKEYSKIILENGRYLMHLIEDILDISKIESNQLEIIYTNFSVKNLLSDVEQVLSQYLHRIEKPQLQLINESPQLNLLLYSDKYRIKQVLTNLLSNAAKFTQSGSIRFGYKVMPGIIEFYVEDSGVGIAKEHLGEIFDRFRKINPPEEARFYRGTGIGLSISKQIIELLGGKIAVESTYGKGSRFSFIIPNHAPPKHFTSNSEGIEPS